MDFSKYNKYIAHSHVQSGQNSDDIKYKILTHKVNKVDYTNINPKTKLTK